MNDEPWPAALSTRMAPPMSSERRMQMASPSPVPPYFRVVEESTWLNALKRRLIPSGEMPIPLSRTMNSIAIASGAGGGASGTAAGRAVLRTSIEMLPLGVNLTALFTRLTTTWRRRVTSPMIQVGTSGAM